MKTGNPLLRRLAALLAVLAFAGVASSVFAGPNLRYTLVEVKSGSECAKRAAAAFASERFPVKGKKSGRVWGSTERTTATIHCMSCGGKTTAVIMVAGSGAKGLMDAFASVLRTGVAD